MNLPLADKVVLYGGWLSSQRRRSGREPAGPAPAGAAAGQGSHTGVYLPEYMVSPEASRGTRGELVRMRLPSGPSPGCGHP